MNNIIRTLCVICNNNKFINSFDIVNTINIVEDINECIPENEIQTLNFVGCNNCGCVQLQNLFDVNELYNQPSCYTESLSWVKHNELFSNFILNNIISHNINIVEIGGGSGKLAKYNLKNIKNIKNYKILEVSSEYNTLENIDYITGNCETYNFNDINVNVIILSHVFEHLYEPRKFIQNIINTNIKEVFISIPDMENLIKNNDINSLNIQHTFYIDTKFITFLFNEHKYELKNIFYYDNNSVFYHFIKNDNNTIQIIDNYKNINLLEVINSFYYNLKQNIKNINTTKPFFICPSGFYGKIVYYYLEKNIQNNVIGFLDSDKNKINKRLCGTKNVIFNKEYIKNMNNVTILVISEKYKNEIVNELLLYNNNIEFIFL